MSLFSFQHFEYFTPLFSCLHGFWREVAFIVCYSWRYQRLKFPLMFFSPLLSFGFPRDSSKVWNMQFFQLYSLFLFTQERYWCGGKVCVWGGGSSIVLWLGLNILVSLCLSTVNVTMLFSFCFVFFFQCRWDKKARGGWSWIFPLPQVN